MSTTLNRLPESLRARDLRPPYRLNMIVRNEAPVIRRCLESLRPLLNPKTDSWTIVDTGSTDGTQALVRDSLSWLPGELHERPWVDFGHNRTEALRLIPDRTGYALFIDADEEVATMMPRLPFLHHDGYTLPFISEGQSFDRLVFASLKVDWTWTGAIHERLTYPGGEILRPTRLEDIGVMILSHPDGARARTPGKHAADLALVEKINDEPRRLFYLAQTHFCSGDLEKAAAFYIARAEHEGGWPEERKFSHLQLQKIAMMTPGQIVMDVVSTSLDAYIAAPDRAGEVLGLLAEYLRNARQPQLAYLFASVAKDQPLPDSGFLVERDWYTRKAKLAFALAADELGKKEEAAAVFAEMERAGSWPPVGRIA